MLSSLSNSLWVCCVNIKLEAFVLSFEPLVGA